MYMHPLRKQATSKLQSAMNHVHAHYGQLPDHRDRVSTGDYSAVLLLCAKVEIVWDCPMIELLPYRSGLETEVCQ